jgi:hypothetical protein
MGSFAAEYVQKAKQSSQAAEVREQGLASDATHIDLADDQSSAEEDHPRGMKDDIIMIELD